MCTQILVHLVNACLGIVVYVQLLKHVRELCLITLTISAFILIMEMLQIQAISILPAFPIPLILAEFRIFCPSERKSKNKSCASKTLKIDVSGIIEKF